MKRSERPSGTTSAPSAASMAQEHRAPPTSAAIPRCAPPPARPPETPQGTGPDRRVSPPARPGLNQLPRPPLQTGATTKDSRFIRFADLARGEVEFQPVAIGGDMAAGDHDRRRTQGLCLERQCRSWQFAAIDSDMAGRLDGVDHRTGNGRAALAQISANEYFAPRRQRAGAVQVVHERRCIGSTRSADQVDGKAPQAAGAEFETAGQHPPPELRGRSAMASGPIARPPIRPFAASDCCRARR